MARIGETRRIAYLTVLAGAAILLATCGRTSTSIGTGAAPPSTAAPPAAPAPPPPARPTPEPATPEPALRTLGPGSRGRAVAELQQALADSTYDPGEVDGVFGTQTQHAVLAFEKVNGLELDGIAQRREVESILRRRPPAAPVRAPEKYVDVDVRRQVLFEVERGVVTHTLPVSTGNGDYYQSTSGIAVAHTPRGSFTIHSKIAGWRVGYLGAMYYPSYFSNGYAVHGSESVPPYPASHGCVRIPMHSTIGFFERNPIGTPVYVHD